jgi:hypothetical protein
VFYVLFRDYKDTIGLSRQNQAMAVVFFATMLLWTVFAMVAPAREVNEVCHIVLELLNCGFEAEPNACL